MNKLEQEHRGKISILSSDKTNHWDIGYQYNGHEFGGPKSTYKLKKDPMRLEYWQVQKLHSWHFDTNNLIGRGLAVDINTL